MGMTITEKILAAHCDRESVEPGDLIYARLDLVLANDITAPIAIQEFEKAGARTVFDPTRIALVADHFTPNKDIASAEQCSLMRQFAVKHQIEHHFDGGVAGIEHALLPEKGLVLPGDAIIGADSHTCTYGALGAFATGAGSTDAAAAMITGEAWFKVPESMKFIYRGKLQEWVGGKDLILMTIGTIGVDGARYRAMEFTGDAIESLPMDDRLTMCNMAIEAGAKNGIIAPDDITLAYVTGRAKRPYKTYASDPDLPDGKAGARYCCTKEYDVSRLEPQVAFPHLPENVRPVSQAGNIKIDQAVIGSCTNGRLSDLRLAAKVFHHRRVAPGVRCIIIPATPLIYRLAMEEGLFETFLEAGCIISPPTCGPCLGGHMGVLAKGERAISTTNRNFVGRMGHPESEVYLSNPAVAAASAIAGKIIHPVNV
jgi:3-isopropylmalate/(R)-2-methylmalate dehydratase large subunit